MPKSPTDLSGAMPGNGTGAAGGVPGWYAAASPRRILIAAAALIALETALLSVLYKQFGGFACHRTVLAGFCLYATSAVMRGFAGIGLVAVFLFALPHQGRNQGHDRRVAQRSERQHERGAHREAAPGADAPGLLARLIRPALQRGWARVHLLGLALIVLPFPFLETDAPDARLRAIAALLSGGAVLTGAGLVLALIAPSGLWGAVRMMGFKGAAILAIALATPEIAAFFQDLWTLEPLARATFHAVHAVLGLAGIEAEIAPEFYIMAVGDFRVFIDKPCAGVEGFALITTFLLLYFWLFREQLKFPRVFLLLPLGILLSWCLNVVRIALLIHLGASWSPELAVEGFHSHAGWMMFTILSLAFASLTHRIAWFRADIRNRPPQDAGPGDADREDRAADPATASPKPGFFEDPQVFRILPFIVFMASSVLASTFVGTPALAYPARALAMVAVLALFWPMIAGTAWRIDPLAAGAGIAIGAIWLVTAPAGGDPGLSAALAAQSPAFLGLWIATRLIGTVLLVPLIEELFFRGYILGRIAESRARFRGREIPGGALAIAGLIVSSALFGAMHGRWLIAGLAGLAFGLLYLRGTRHKPDLPQSGGYGLADAVIAHALANAVIGGQAALTGDWALI